MSKILKKCISFILYYINNLYYIWYKKYKIVLFKVIFSWPTCMLGAYHANSNQSNTILTQLLALPYLLSLLSKFKDYVTFVTFKNGQILFQTLLILKFRNKIILPDWRTLCCKTNSLDWDRRILNLFTFWYCKILKVK